MVEIFFDFPRMREEIWVLSVIIKKFPRVRGVFEKKFPACVAKKNFEGCNFLVKGCKKDFA